MQLADTVVVFDLDDTLYKEADYVDAAFRRISGGDDALYESMKRVGRPYEAFELLDDALRETAVEIYRSGDVELSDTEGASAVIGTLRGEGAAIAVVTDGWSRRQRAKLDRLGLSDMIDLVLVSEEVGSEKTSGVAFETIMTRFPAKRYVYIGDNPAKDFVAANRRGWTTVMVGPDSRNIHTISPESLDGDYLPDVTVAMLTDVTPHLIMKLSD